MLYLLLYDVCVTSFPDYQFFFAGCYLQGKQLIIHHMAPFDHLLRDTSMAVLEAIREAAVSSENPALFLQGKQGTYVRSCV